MNKFNDNWRMPQEESDLQDGRYEDVEFSEEMADAEDWEALERSERADQRQETNRRL